MTFNLINLDVTEISGVDEGANQHADVLFMKQKGTESMDIKDIEKNLAVAEAEVTSLKKQLADRDKADTEVKKSLTAIEDIAKAKDVEIAKAKETITAQTAEIAKLKGDKADLELTSEVQKNFPKSAGTDAEKVAKLKAIRAIPDESVRKSMEADLVKVEAQAADFAKAKGKDEDAAGAASDEDALDAMAKKFATDNKVSVAKGMSEVLKTKEGKALYAAQGKATKKED